MCGLVGIVGRKCKSLLQEAMKNIRYRGYDSQGIILVRDDGRILIHKSLGDEEIHIEDEQYIISIGHHRWATHGEVSIENTHPHTVDNISIVHNGTVDDIERLKSNVQDYVFRSDTDTEFLAYILSRYNHDEKIHEDDILNKLHYVINNIPGYYVFLFTLNKKIYAASRNMSLYIIYGNDFISFSSDSSALEGNFINIKGYGYISLEKTEFFNNSGIPIDLSKRSPTISHIDSDENNITIKEINSSLDVVKKIINLNYSFPLHEYKRIAAIGCGSSYFAALMLELYSDYKIKALTPSECKSKYDLLIVISQSGETMDIISSISKIECKKIGIINREKSSIDLLMDKTIYCMSGLEKGVAATKSVLSQMLICRILCKHSTDGILQDINKALLLDIDDIVQSLYESRNIAFLGEMYTYPIALEASLKFIELTYIPALGIKSSEFKHGYIALVDESFTAVMLCENKNLRYQIMSRKGKVIELYKLLSSELALLVLIHRIASALCLKKNLNLDKPRNLAKSITVL